jgi:hypothetical protein
LKTISEIVLENKEQITIFLKKIKQGLSNRHTPLGEGNKKYLKYGFKRKRVYRALTWHGDQ